MVDETGIGAAQGFGAEVILLDPVESSRRQRRVLTMRHGAQVDVAGFTQEDGADTGREIASARLRLADVGELVGKACPGLYLQEGFRRGRRAASER